MSKHQWKSWLFHAVNNFLACVTGVVHCYPYSAVRLRGKWIVVFRTGGKTGMKRVDYEVKPRTVFTDIASMQRGYIEGLVKAPLEFTHEDYIKVIEECLVNSGWKRE